MVTEYIRDAKALGVARNHGYLFRLVDIKSLKILNQPLSSKAAAERFQKTYSKKLAFFEGETGHSARSGWL